MPDLCAAVGLAQMRQYEATLLPERLRIFQQYQHGFGVSERFILPPFDAPDGTLSSAHLYMLRIRGASEQARDAVIQRLSDQGIGVNVHYIPMPMLRLFKALGYRMEDFPNTYQLYKNEISLPVYNGLRDAQIERVIEGVKQATG
jgi:dTDP-4-amino-4,6-dideoxygalactose transaminase